MPLPTTRQLRHFVALAETEHFARAAEACHVSPSAFSTSIRELESLLGTQLVDRTNRQVTITATGQDVATQARLCLNDIKALVALASEPHEPLAGELRLGVIPTIAPFLLPKILPRLQRAYPALRLYLTEGETREIHAKLEDGALDLLLLALPFDLRNCEVTPLFRDPFMLACHRRTALVDPANYRFNRLNAGSVLLLENGHCLRDHALSACRIRDTEKVSRFAATSLLTLVAMINADLGITFLPQMAAGSALLRNTGVRLHPLGERSYRTIGLAWRTGSARGDEFRLFGDFIHDQGPKPG